MLNVYVAAKRRVMDLRDRVSDDESGAALVEYALLVGLMALGVIAAAKALTPAMLTSMTNIGTTLTNNVKVG